ncbi:MAG: aminoacyl-tRNA hydrolase [Anaerolineae bacterium]|nr:aminoacyl-tRNA hydrolase [Anaerolineae bacterium]
MHDIIQRLGSNAYPRLRIGIGRPPGRMDPAAYVLRPFDAEALPVVEEVRWRAVSALETWLAEGIEVAMTRHNGPGEQPDDAANDAAEAEEEKIQSRITSKARTYHRRHGAPRQGEN